MYVQVVWIIFDISLSFFVLVLVVAFSIFYVRRSSVFKKEIKLIKDELLYIHKLFGEHFKVTDRTILDLRKDKKELQKEIASLKKTQV